MKDWNEFRERTQHTLAERKKNGRADDNEGLAVMQVVVLSHIAEQLQKLVELAERAE